MQLSNCKLTVAFHPISWKEDFPILSFKRNPSTSNVNALHFHSGLEIGICREGSGVFYIYNKALPFQSGDMIVAFANQPHVIVSNDKEPSSWDFIMADTDRLYRSMGVTDYKPICDLLGNKKFTPNFLSNGTNEEFGDIAKLIISELNNKFSEHQLTVKALLWAFLLKLTRLSDYSHEDWKVFHKHEANFKFISPAIELISNQYYQEISIEMLSNICNFSVPSFERVFKRIMKQSPMAYLKSVRMRMAGTLLRSTDMLILDIASEVGYKSISSFNRHFLQVKKMTPREYRTQFR